MIHRWSSSDVPFAFYTKQELRTIHRTFGHPSVNALQMLWWRVNGNAIDFETMKTIEKIKDGCKICHQIAGSPKLFKLTVGWQELKFNIGVQVGSMFIGKRPVLHMVWVKTHFCTAWFLQSQATKEI